MPRIRKSGLPDDIGMKHDDHFVDLISKRSSGPKIRMIDLTNIDPNPNNARTEIGDLKELVNSINEKGVLEPIIVRSKNGRYEIIAGERRFVASKMAKLSDIPCIVMNVKDHEAMEIALIENLQRKDLEVFEEADGLKALSDNFGFNHQKIATKIGKARSTVTEIINISRIPLEIRNLCKNFKITSRSTLVEIAKQKNKENMLKLFYEIRDRDLRREDTRDLSKSIIGKERKRKKKYIFNFRPEGTDEYRVKIEFKKKNITKKEIISILEEMIKNLKSE